jgi:gliding motility-associated-like protein
LIRKNIFYVFTIFFSFFWCLKSFPQLTTSSTPTASDLIGHLVGNGIKYSGVKYTGDNLQKGTFDGSKSNIGFSKGIILSTGKISNAIGPNDDPVGGSPYVADLKKSYDFGRIGDGDLDAIQPSSAGTNDACVLEFDFIPQSTHLSFRYVFASEEYPFYVCSPFNDIFAFFLSGPNPSGPAYNKKNIAFIPGTTIPVAINSVNSGTPGYDPISGTYYPSTNCTSLSYSSLFINNGDGSTPGANPTVQYNGFITPFTATAEVIPCKSYHIKIAIADGGDGKYDSAVLLEESSFSSTNILITVTYSKPAIDTLSTVEGCNDAEICFNIGVPLSTDYVIPLNYKGSTADTTGKDFPVLPKSVTIKAGQTKTCFTLFPILDNISEGSEKLEINANVTPCGWDTLNLFISDNTKLNIDATPISAAICEDDSVTLSVNASGGITKIPYEFTWSSGETGVTQMKVSPKASTTYTVTVEDACGATASVSIPVKVNPKPAIVISNDTSICSGKFALLKVSGADPGGTYNWSNGDNKALISVSPTTDTEYILTVTTSFGCFRKDSVTVTVNPNPTVNPGNDTAVCSGFPAILIAKATPQTGISFKWSSGQTSPSINVIPANTTTYTVTVTDANKCTAQGSVIVTVNPIPTSTFSIIPSPVCVGQTATITYTGNGTPTAIYKWNVNGDTTKTGPGPFQIVWDTAGNKVISLTVKYLACSSSEIVNNIQVVPLPAPDFTAANVSGCQPLTVQFTDNSKQTFPNSQYLWDFGDGRTSTEKNPVHTYTAAGNFSVSLTISNSASGCSNKKSVPDLIKVFPKPIANYYVLPSNIVTELDPTVTIVSNSVGNITDYEWTISDRDTVYADSVFTHTFLKNGTFNVLLIVTNNYGCIDSISGKIIVELTYTFYVPNAFNPLKCQDLDNCKFKVKSTNISSFDIKIFSRWGSMVYQSKNIEDGWDGKVKGKFAEEGVYVYRIDYRDQLRRQHVLYGNVTLLR